MVVCGAVIDPFYLTHLCLQAACELYYCTYYNSSCRGMPSHGVWVGDSPVPG